MAPFDFNYIQDDVETATAFRPQDRFVPSIPLLVAPRLSGATPATRPCGLLHPHDVHLDEEALHQRTPSHLEFILQVLDKNAFLTSLIFICAYAGVLRSL